VSERLVISFQNDALLMQASTIWEREPLGTTGGH
jgi:hypothetical protein